MSAPKRPVAARVLFVQFAEKAAQAVHVCTGRFGADMQVSLVNDGPVTFWLQARAPGKS